MVVVYGMPIRRYGRYRRPLRRPICAAMTSLCQFQSALTFGEFPHAGLRAPFPRHSCREIPGDVTHTPSLRGFRCRLACAYRPGNPLCAFREQNARYAARGALHTRAHGNPRLPNSINPRLHFNRPRGRLVSDVERFRAGSRRRARPARARSAPRTSHMPSREPGAVTKLTRHGAEGSPHPSPV